MNHGMPHFENMDAQRGPPVLAKNLMRNIGARDQLAWKHVELIRKRWKGKLVVKGLVSPADARIARESGVDGVMLSNHGGRQLDYTMSGLRTLPEIAAEAKGMTIMVDGGIRRGTDVIKALALGAHFVLGRPAVPLRRDRRRRGRRATRDQPAPCRDRPRPRATRHSQHQRDHAGSGAEVLRPVLIEQNRLERVSMAMSLHRRDFASNSGWIGAMAARGACGRSQRFHASALYWIASQAQVAPFQEAFRQDCASWAMSRVQIDRHRGALCGWKGRAGAGHCRRSGASQGRRHRGAIRDDRANS